MIQITLLDGSKLEFANPVSGWDIANSISANLAKASYAILVDGELWDLHRTIDKSAKVQLITIRDKELLLPMLRHDMAHLLAEAILELYPGTKLAIGPATEVGFFYDVDPKEPFSQEDLLALEERMKEIIDRKEEISRTVVATKEAIALYTEAHEPYKLEILSKLESETVTFYKQGILNDLCRGPHSPNTNMIPKAFKLTKVSSVYWQGDVNNPSLQRIYGIGFLNQKDLDAYLQLQEELIKNDHRKLGKEMDLFHIQEEAAGSVFWHEKGWRLYRTLENYIRHKLDNNDYHEVKTPQLYDKSLWEKSGHWDKYGNNMFIIENSENSTLGLKPMNCPGHVQIFKQEQRSYKDLPYKMAEFGSCHRNEPSGSLHGIMRVRAFTQDDAHIFCSEDQIVSETEKFCVLLKEVYQEIFGHNEIIVKFSDRPAVRAGSDEVWDKAEQSLWHAAKEANLEPILSKGEGAFYGPKLEFAIKDSLGREWQLGTLQVDFVLPERLGASYIGEDDKKHIPVMLHRAILGSFERFIGILLEHFKGHVPLWLAPVQIVIVTVSNKFDSFAEKTKEKFKQANILAEVDLRAKTVSAKIREHTLAKVPLIAVIGEKELEKNSVTIRIYNQEQQKTIAVEELIDIIQRNIENNNVNIEL